MFELNLTEFLVQDKIGREDIISWASWDPKTISTGRCSLNSHRFCIQCAQNPVRAQGLSSKKSSLYTN